MDNKTIILGVVVGMLIIGGLLAVVTKEGGISTGSLMYPSSPSGTVKAFFNALDKGDLEEAESYLVADKSIDTFLFFGFWANQEQRVKCARSYKGRIEVEIKAEEKEKMFGEEQAMVVVKYTLGPHPEREDQGEYTEKFILKKENGQWKIVDTAI